MKHVNKHATTSISVDKTVAKVQKLLVRKDVREMSLQSATLGTRFTIRTNTKVYNFWLPGTSGLVAFARVLQEQLTRAKGEAEHQETP